MSFFKQRYYHLGAQKYADDVKASRRYHKERKVEEGHKRAYDTGKCHGWQVGYKAFGLPAADRNPPPPDEPYRNPSDYWYKRGYFEGWYEGFRAAQYYNNIVNEG